MEAQGETEFLTKLLCVYAAAEQQKHSRTLQLIEENIQTVTRAIRRMLWVMLGGVLLLWGNNVVAEWLPPALSTFGAKIAGCLLIGAGISFVAFTAYRALAERKLEQHRQQCRALLEAALDWRAVSDAALGLQAYARTELQCSRCGMQLVGSPQVAQIGENRTAPRRVAPHRITNGAGETTQLKRAEN